MNIIYISKYASYAPYGIETRHVYLSKYLANKGHKVELYTSDSNHQLTSRPAVYEECVDGVNVHWLKTLKYKKAYGLLRIISWIDFEFKLRRRLKKTNNLQHIDVVIVSSLSLLSIINGIWLKKKIGCKLVFEVRDIWPLVLTRISSIKATNPIYKILAKIEKWGYQNADIVLGTMPNLKEHVKTVIGSYKTTLWMPHLVNSNVQFSETHKYSANLKDLRDAGYTKIVAYAGSINKSSAVELLLKMGESIKPHNVAIVLLGDGPLLEVLRAKYKASNVVFYDKIPQNQVVAFLKECDILYDGYLKSDIYKYGNSRNKYVEYCLSAKPILVSYQGFDFFVSTYQCGLVVEPESHQDLLNGLLELVYKEDDVLHTMGQNAHNFALQNLQIETQVQKLLDAISDV
jgi:glycosyltransferase involved in cell wall biosynthesis